MGSFIICDRPLSKKPYYISEAGLHIYSGQELCYFIYHNVMMLDDAFVSDGLICFLEEDLGMAELGGKLRQWKGRLTASQMLLMIVEGIDYYNKEEMDFFRRQLKLKDAAMPYDRMKNRADYMVKQRHYLKAIELYDYVIQKRTEWSVPEDVFGKLWHNKGFAQAGMFLMQAAADSLVCAYGILKDADVLREIFYLHLLEPKVVLPEDVLEKIPAQQQYRWLEEYEVHDRQASCAPSVRRLEASLKNDNYRRREDMERILADWKQEYREMVQ